ncbi:hypothetical protein N9F34_05685, partial [Alphaproteobacteria bacterium]|nr:hypothetical protein [Alphaproteobacteria bacterium]
VTGDLRSVFVLDNHYPLGGLGGHVATLMGQFGHPPRFHHFAVDGVPACGTNEQVLAFHELDADHLTRRIRAALS